MPNGEFKRQSMKTDRGLQETKHKDESKAEQIFLYIKECNAKKKTIKEEN